MVTQLRMEYGVVGECYSTRQSIVRCMLPIYSFTFDYGRRSSSMLLFDREKIVINGIDIASQVRSVPAGLLPAKRFHWYDLTAGR